MIKELETMIKDRENKIDVLTKSVQIVKRGQTADQLAIEIEMLTAEIKTIQEVNCRLNELQKMGALKIEEYLG